VSSHPESATAKERVTVMLGAVTKVRGKLGQLVSPPVGTVLHSTTAEAVAP
jgi:hypothetical protein